MQPARTPQDEEITIIGAGLVGCLLAKLLSLRGHRVQLFEGRPDPRRVGPPPGRSINLTLAERGWRALRAAGIDGRIKEICIPLLGRMIHDPSGATRFQPYGSRDEAIYSVSRTRLNALLQTIIDEDPNIRVHFNHRCRQVDLDTGTLWFDRPEGGEPLAIRSQRVIAADGASSTVRRAMLKEDDSFRYFQKISPVQYKELAIKPAANGQWALAPNALHLWPRGGCFLVAFPNLDKSMTCSLFLPASGGEASFASINTRDDVLGFFKKFAPDVMPMIPHLVHDFFAGPPNPVLSSYSRPWIHGTNLALIGDSAHAMVPFLGQGMNCGFEDCMVFVQLLDQHHNDWSRALPEYQQQRMDNCEAAVRLAEHHYLELAVRAQDPRFPFMKQLEQRLAELAPEKFVPLYHQVTFRDTPYSHVEQITERQEAMVARMMELPELKQLDSPEAVAKMRELLAEL